MWVLYSRLRNIETGKLLQIWSETNPHLRHPTPSLRKLHHPAGVENSKSVSVTDFFAVAVALPFAGKFVAHGCGYDEVLYVTPCEAAVDAQCEGDDA